MTIHENYSLLAHNTFNIDQSCRRFISIESVEDATKLCHLITPEEPYIIIGRGSNLLLTKDFEGTVVRCDIHGREILSGNRVRCGAGETVDDVIEWTLQKGLYGMENLSHIPGEVGASAVQNVGAYGVEAKDVIESVEMVEVATGKILTVSNKNCCYGYRQSRFKKDWKNRFLITHVTYQLTTVFEPKTSYGNISASLQNAGIDAPTALDMRRVITDIRQSKLPDPEVTGNAGSFFMNPVVSNEEFERLKGRYNDIPYYDMPDGQKKIPAGWLIDQCGWKGRQMGNAAVHDKQALVLVNKGGAKGSEVLELCRKIQQDVEENYNIIILPEVNII